MDGNQRVAAGALVVVLVGLLLVGLASGTIARHVLQVLPVAAVIWAVVHRRGWSRFAAMAVFAFWLAIMVMIWLHLLGLPSAITGRFTAVEVGLTLAIGLACVVGLGASVRGPSRSRWWACAMAFAAFATLQAAAMWVSLRPAFADR